MANDLPVPQDDGAARHLTGKAMPDILLMTTDGGSVNFSELAGRSPEISPHLGEDLAEHFGGQHPGIRVVTRAVIAVE